MSTIDIQSIVNHGVLAINTGLFTNTATGIHSTNDLTANDVSFFDTGFAIDVVSGTAGVVGLGLDNVSVGIGSDSGASTTVSSIYGQHVALAVDGTDADDLWFRRSFQASTLGHYEQHHSSTSISPAGYRAVRS